MSNTGSQMVAETTSKAGIKELFKFFVLMGTTAFGGPAAHFAIMEREVVRNRNWVSKEEFVDVMGLLNLIPGPNSTQMVMYMGYRKNRLRGILAAGLGFIVPAFIITFILSWFYVTYGLLPQVQAVFFGIQPVVLAVILSALWRLAPHGVNSWQTGVLCGAAVIASFCGVNEAIIILASGAIGWFWFSGWRPAPHKISGNLLLAAPALFASADNAPGLPVTLPSIFLVFTKMAVTLYGTGYLLIAYMQGDLVDGLGWLSVQQLLDVIAIGQMTPGPFLTTATAAGMLLAGWPGAIVATIGIFLPSFFLVGLLGNKVSYFRSSTWGKHMLKGINAAVIAVLLVVAFTFAGEVVNGGWIRVPVVLAALFLLERLRVNSMILVVAGGILGIIWHYIPAIAG
jgi:chromate transporter